ncbi:MAG: hypothetical protein JNL67_12785 [Planctomycetaceae bacterium]|nr:hypothetical protein [Planctomycetaceae bacterium]
MRYSIRFMVIVTAIIAIVPLCAANLTQTSYAFCCLIVPATLALACRYAHNSKHGLASLVAIVSAIAIGSLLLAYGSYDKTFNNRANGFLVGDGWNSVAVSAIVGGIAGLLCGMVSLMLYLILTVVIGRPSSGTPDEHTG